jgi:competence ComEA-like helix-hairpin-helix protein
VPNQEISLEEIKTAVAELLQQTSKVASPLLTQFAELHERRAARLAAAEARLKTQLGEDHPRVVALRRAATEADEWKRATSTMAERLARRPKLRPHEWVVFGQVLDAEGNPAAGLRVRVYDKDRQYDDLLGDTTTDEYGDFAAIYHERDFAEVGEELPELYVMVEDKKGNLLYSSRDHVRYSAGRAEYFEIVLSETLPGETAEQAEGKERVRVNVNTATISELKTLPGIGPELARAIEENRPYNTVDELVKVPGIGRHTLGRLKERVTVSRP